MYDKNAAMASDCLQINYFVCGYQMTSPACIDCSMFGSSFTAEDAEVAQEVTNAP
jgi:hypothetical protein